MQMLRLGLVPEAILCPDLATFLFFFTHLCFWLVHKKSSGVALPVKKGAAMPLIAYQHRLLQSLDLSRWWREIQYFFAYLPT